MEIIVIGSGMYVSGRGTSGYGTILPAIAKWKKQTRSSDVVRVVATSRESARELESKAHKLENITGVDLNLITYPRKLEQDDKAYNEAFADSSKEACVIVAVPDHLHFEVTKAALLANYHTLVVKPLTPSLKEAKELVRISENLNLYGAVEFHKRYDRANKMLHDLIQDGSLGTPLYSLVEYSQRKSIPTEFFSKWSNKTSILQYLGVHYIDLIRFVTKAKPIRVMAIGQKTWLLSKNIDTYDSIQCVIEWQIENGKTFTETIITSWLDPNCTSAMSEQKIKFAGDKGLYESDQKDRGIRITLENDSLQHVNPDFCRPYYDSNNKLEWEGYGIDSVFVFLDDTTNLYASLITIDELNKNRPIFSEALYSTVVVERAHESLNDNSSWKTIEL
jgi:D-galacturonate reductase